MSLPADNLTTLDADRLMADLVERRLLESARAAAVLDEFRGEHPSSDPFALVEYLVHSRLLTPFQAERALAGNLSALSLGPYLLLEPISGGNGGVVYKTVSRTDQREYAVRVLPPPGPWQMKGAKAVWATLAALPGHPAVMPLTDVESADGTEYLVWPFADGESLEHSVERVGPLTPTDAARVFAELADGLAECHDRGITHGCVRPSKILIGYDRRPRLTDLGLGTVLADTAGVPPAEPNEAIARGRVADTYALGSSLYYCLTSTSLPLTRTDGSLPPPPVRSRNPAVPEGLANIVDALLRETLDDLRPVGMELRAAVPQPSAARSPDPSNPAADLFGQDTPSDTPPWAMTVPNPGMNFRAPKRPGWFEAAESINFDLPGETPAVSEDWNARDQADSLARLQAVPPPVEPAAPIPLRAAPRPAVAPPAVLPLKPADGSDSKRRAMPSPIDVRSKSQESAVIQTRPRVAVPEPPLFARSTVRKARSLMFWKGTSDAVMVSVFGPPAISPGQRVQLLVYANVPESFDGVATLCRALHAEADLLGVGYIDRPVPHQTKVGLHLAVANAGVAKSLTEFTWSGQTQPRTYELFVPWESPSGLTTGMMTAGVNNERAGAIPFYFVVLPRSG